jgi:hypothetical protein
VVYRSHQEKVGRSILWSKVTGNELELQIRSARLPSDENAKLFAHVFRLHRHQLQVRIIGRPGTVAPTRLPASDRTAIG